LGGSDLAEIYACHCRELGLGQPGLHDQPLHPYNLLFDDSWFLTVRRLREHCAGFSVNGLGFAGYLLGTHRSDLNWLQQKGPWALLEAVAAPAD
jgi:ATP adenylyltransferase